MCAEGGSHLSLSDVDLIFTYVFTNTHCSILTNTTVTEHIGEAREGETRVKKSKLLLGMPVTKKIN